MSTTPRHETPTDTHRNHHDTHAAADAGIVHDTDPSRGLTATDAARRLAEIGPNELTPPRRVPLWRRVIRSLSDRMVLVLLAAAAVSAMVERELKTPLVIVAVVVVNVTLGLVQEGKASRALEALRAMTADQARVRRDGQVREMASAEIVPGDVVLLEAGDRVPADGRLVVARELELDESALTGESLPVARHEGLVHMHTTVTRGRGEIVVSATGMATEIGRVAGLLGHDPHPVTPLQRQLHQLAGRLAVLAGAVIAVVMAIGLVRGREFGEVFASSVALAVASIPEGLPAVTAVTLALGVQRMARRNAIVKRLAAVETLGCTTVICTDKTGTLTTNRMTAREMVGDERLIEAVVLCSDASIDGDRATGDPTEVALLGLADPSEIASIRAMSPRIAEQPFESATKLMVTVHESAGTASRVIAKGALDVLLPRCTSFAVAADVVQREHDRMATDGVRVLAVAEGQHTGPIVGPAVDVAVGLRLLGLVGIVDPPRPEAARAIADAHAAGIEVKMITGDHAVTAAAIGRELGLNGWAVTGTDLDAVDAGDPLPTDATVFARVTPEHKLRLVHALQARGEVVAMTGDGVNDAPALERADMGVAMGINGTDVSKQAADMILADDDFSTIVRAVEEGRAIYDGIVHFVRFQLSTSLGFAALFLLAAALGVGAAAPFSAVAILWVNLIMDGPPAMALGIDPPEADVMRRPPRPPDQPILTPSRWFTIGLAATVMAAGTLAVLAWAPETPSRAGGGTGATTATAMAFTTFVLFQVFNLLNSRSDRASVFGRRTLRNRWLWVSLAVVLALQVVVLHVGPAQRFMGLAPIGIRDWLVCAAVASSVLWVEEGRKLIVRRGSGRSWARSSVS